MSTNRHLERICIVIVILALIVAALLASGQTLGIESAGNEMGYESLLFDTSAVHTVDIEMEDWDSFIETCENEEYSACTVTIDGEKYANVAIRAKGNTSLSTVASMGSQRYSFKIEFDHYDDSLLYHGLDKLCLNNLIQDNTMMKDYLTYRMMNAFGVSSPLCSFVFITVNGEDWGLYLAVEGVEESFLQRNYGNNYGDLYKPDSMSMGGGRGNGAGFDPEDMMERLEERMQQAGRDTAADVQEPAQGERPDWGQMPDPGQMPELPEGEMPSGRMGGMGGGMGSDDVKLRYIDDDPESYSNLFDSAKTDVTTADQNRLIQSLESLSAYENLEAVLDIDQVLRYFVVHNFVVNGDSYTGSMIHNYYLYEEDGRLSMIPWDYNLAFGTFQGGQATSEVNDPIDDVLDDRPMQAWIFSDETYTQQYHQLYEQFLQTVDVQALIEEAYALITPYVERDPTRFCTVEEYETGVEAIKDFCALRAESVSGQLSGEIPSTSEGQSADPDALVDASGLTLSDMGTMNNGGGRGGKGGFAGGAQGDFTPPGETEDEALATPPGETGDEALTAPPGETGDEALTAQPGETEDKALAAPPGETGDEALAAPPGETGDEALTAPSESAGGQAREERTWPGGGMPGMENAAAPSGTVDAQTWILLGACAVVLAVGLIVAFRFRH